MHCSSQVVVAAEAESAAAVAPVKPSNLTIPRWLAVPRCRSLWVLGAQVERLALLVEAGPLRGHSEVSPLEAVGERPSTAMPLMAVQVVEVAVQPRLERPVARLGVPALETQVGRDTQASAERASLAVEVGPEFPALLQTGALKAGELAEPEDFPT